MSFRSVEFESSTPLARAGSFLDVVRLPRLLSSRYASKLRRGSSEMIDGRSLDITLKILTFTLESCRLLAEDRKIWRAQWREQSLFNIPFHPSQHTIVTPVTVVVNETVRQ